MRILSDNRRLLLALVTASLASLTLLIIRIIRYQTLDYWFLAWNLFLAWIPLLVLVVMVHYINNNPWVSWRGILLTLLWFGFLPNSFYIASDLVHLQYANDSSLLLDAVIILSFTFSGFLLGYLSLYLLHIQLLKRLKPIAANIAVGFILLICSFAIYVGRYLRWSTWDVLVNPAGLLFDVSDRFINPTAHEQTFRTTVVFFVLLGSIYIAMWQIAAVLRNSKKVI